MIDRSYIGHKSDPVVVAVEPFQLRFFAKATGEYNPIYFDEKAARAAGHKNILAPPTFASCLGIGDGDSFGELPANGYRNRQGTAR